MGLEAEEGVGRASRTVAGKQGEHGAKGRYVGMSDHRDDDASEAHQQNRLALQKVERSLPFEGLSMGFPELQRLVAEFMVEVFLRLFRQSRFLVHVELGEHRDLASFPCDFAFAS
jgi:hypothetical protein